MRRPARPGERLEAAKLAAAAAQAEVAASSRKRLAELERLPAHARLEALNDPALEPEERDRLRRSLAPLLAKTAKPAASTKTPLALHDFTMLLNWKIIALAAVIVATAVAAGRSRSERAILTQSAELRALMPDGRHAPLSKRGGETVIISSRDRDTATIRVWRAREGYAFASVPTNMLRITAP